MGINIIVDGCVHSFDGKEYLLAAGRDEKCQFYKFVKTQEAVKEGREEAAPTQAPNNGKDTGTVTRPVGPVSEKVHISVLESNFVCLLLVWVQP